MATVSLRSTASLGMIRRRKRTSPSCITRVTCDRPRVTRCTSHDTHRITRHTSHITRHTSHATRHSSTVDSNIPTRVSPRGGGSGTTLGTVAEILVLVETRRYGSLGGTFRVIQQRSPVLKLLEPVQLWWQGCLAAMRGAVKDDAAGMRRPAVIGGSAAELVQLWQGWRGGSACGR
jgi:hypothetical protein